MPGGWRSRPSGKRWNSNRAFRKEEELSQPSGRRAFQNVELVRAQAETWPWPILASSSEAGEVGRKRRVWKGRLRPNEGDFSTNL